MKCISRASWCYFYHFSSASFWHCFLFWASLLQRAPRLSWGDTLVERFAWSLSLWYVEPSAWYSLFWQLGCSSDFPMPSRKQVSSAHSSTLVNPLIHFLKKNRILPRSLSGWRTIKVLVQSICWIWNQDRPIQVQLHLVSRTRYTTSHISNTTPSPHIPRLVVCSAGNWVYSSSALHDSSHPPCLRGWNLLWGYTLLNGVASYFV